MTIQYKARNLITGLSTDTKPSTTLTQDKAIYFETDAMKYYVNNAGVGWSAADTDTAQTLTNKTFDSEKDTLSNLFAGQIGWTSLSYKRVGLFMPCPVPGVGTYGPLKDLNTPGDVISDAIIDTDNTAEGPINKFTANSTGVSIGMGSISTAKQLLTRRAHNPSLTVRCRIDGDAANSRLYIGFSSVGTGLPVSDTVLANADSGVIAGWNTATANFSVFNNDGSGAMVTNTMGSGIAKDTTGYHTFSIIMSSSNVVITLDGGNTVTLTTRIPATTTPLYAYFHGERVI